MNDEAPKVDLLLDDDRIVQLLSTADNTLLALTAYGFVLQFNPATGDWHQFRAPISTELYKILSAADDEEETRDGTQETH